MVKLAFGGELSTMKVWTQWLGRNFSFYLPKREGASHPWTLFILRQTIYWYLPSARLPGVFGSVLERFWKEIYQGQDKSYQKRLFPRTLFKAFILQGFQGERERTRKNWGLYNFLLRQGYLDLRHLGRERKKGLNYMIRGSRGSEGKDHSPEKYNNIYCELF